MHKWLCWMVTVGILIFIWILFVLKTVILVFVKIDLNFQQALLVILQVYRPISMLLLWFTNFPQSFTNHTQSLNKVTFGSEPQIAGWPTIGPPWPMNFQSRG